MVCIGINRSIAIVLPLRYSTLVTKRTVILMVVLVWMIPVVLMVPLQVYAVGRGYLPNGILFLDWTLAISSIIWILLLCLSLAILYGKIIQESRAQAQKVQAWQQNKSVRSTAGPNGNESRSDRNKKSTKLVLIILSVAMVLNTPYLMYSILLLYGVAYGTPMITLVLVAQQCYLANSGINIFIYALFVSDFRKAYKAMFCCLCCKPSGAEVREFSEPGNTHDTQVMEHI
jgi:small-conductance mechanosensitive channel